MAEIEVVGAVVEDAGMVLCAQRGPSQSLAGMWEFPGGKIEGGESPEAALQRELVEELGCRVNVGDHIVRHQHVYANITIVLTTYWCSLEEGVPTASEHAELRWVSVKELDALEWAPADIPTVQALMQALPS